MTKVFIEQPLTLPGSAKHRPSSSASVELEGEGLLHHQHHTCPAGWGWDVEKEASGLGGYCSFMTRYGVLGAVGPHWKRGIRVVWS